MDILSATHLSVPIMQVILLLALSTLALIFGRLKLALLVNYSFTLYWGYVSNLATITESGSTALHNFTLLYLGFGLVIIILALVGFVYYRD